MEPSQRDALLWWHAPVSYKVKELDADNKEIISEKSGLELQMWKVRILEVSPLFLRILDEDKKESLISWLSIVRVSYMDAEAKA